MKKVLTVKCEEGFCPLCGQELVYGTKKIMDYRGRASWECPKCKATGDEGFDAVFDGMHYNVHDADGKCHLPILGEWHFFCFLPNLYWT